MGGPIRGRRGSVNLNTGVPVYTGGSKHHPIHTEAPWKSARRGGAHDTSLTVVPDNRIHPMGIANTFGTFQHIETNRHQDPHTHHFNSGFRRDKGPWRPWPLWLSHHQKFGCQYGETGDGVHAGPRCVTKMGVNNF